MGLVGGLYDQLDVKTMNRVNKREHIDRWERLHRFIIVSAFRNMRCLNDERFSSFLHRLYVCVKLPNH